MHNKCLILTLLILYTGCNGINCCQADDIYIGEMHDYKFENKENDNYLTKEITSITQAVRWMKDNIEYKKDPYGDYWKLPEETFNDKSGDCEDLCILFLYIVIEKLNINMDLLGIKNKETRETHIWVYPYPFGSKKKPMFYDVADNQIISSVLHYLYINKTIPYPELIWMVYHYHDNVGKYK